MRAFCLLSLITLDGWILGSLQYSEIDLRGPKLGHEVAFNQLNRMISGPTLCTCDPLASGCAYLRALLDTNIVLTGLNHSMRLNRYFKEHTGSNALLSRVISTESTLLKSDYNPLLFCASDYARIQNATTPAGSLVVFFLSCVSL